MQLAPGAGPCVLDALAAPDCIRQLGPPGDLYQVNCHRGAHIPLNTS
jgi:hypothetical protein